MMLAVVHFGNGGCENEKARTQGFFCCKSRALFFSHQEEVLHYDANHFSKVPCAQRQYAIATALAFHICA